MKEKLMEMLESVKKKSLKFEDIYMKILNYLLKKKKQHNILLIFIKVKM